MAEYLKIRQFIPVIIFSRPSKIVVNMNYRVTVEEVLLYYIGIKSPPKSRILTGAGVNLFGRAGRGQGSNFGRDWGPGRSLS